MSTKTCLAVFLRDVSDCGWEYEDQLPDDISDTQYKLMFDASRVISGVRMYPFLEGENGKRFWVGCYETVPIGFMAT